MQHAWTGLRAPARMLVSGSRDCPCHADASEQRRSHVRNPLRHKLHVVARCFRPVMPSAIFADSRLSTPPRRVKETAVGSSSSRRGQVTAGSDGRGCAGCHRSDCRWFPRANRAWPPKATPERLAISIPGHIGRQRRTAKMADVRNGSTQKSCPNSVIVDTRLKMPPTTSGHDHLWCARRLTVLRCRGR